MYNVMFARDIMLNNFPDFFCQIFCATQQQQHHNIHRQQWDTHKLGPLFVKWWFYFFIRCVYGYVYIWQGVLGWGVKGLTPWYVVLLLDLILRNFALTWCYKIN